MTASPVSLTRLLSDHRMCLICLAEKVGLNTDAVSVALRIMERSLPLRRKTRACPFCGVPGTVYSLDTPKSSASEAR